MKRSLLKAIPAVFVLFATLLLSGCDYVLFDPKGRMTEGIFNNLMLTVGLMLIVVIPTIIMVIWFPIKYRKSGNAAYEPDWEHSNKLEFFIWGIPITLIVILAIATYIAAFKLDPRVPMQSDKEKITIQVVAMDWKWLFIYPEQEIATVNELVVPVHSPIEFLITSDTTMNSFNIPQLTGQLYAMGGMENRLNMIANEEGVYRGFSSNYSGYGFSGMKFNTYVVSDSAFADWVSQIQNANATGLDHDYNKAKPAPAKSNGPLDDAQFARLSVKTRKHPVEYFSGTDPLLFKRLIEKYTGVQQ